MITRNLTKPNITVFFLATLVMLTCSTNATALNETANSCSASDIQSTLDHVISAGGGTVNIPACQADNTWENGDYVAVTTDVEFRLLGAGKDKTVIGYADNAGPPSGIPGGYSRTAMNFWGTGLKELGNFTLKGSDTGEVSTLVYLRAGQSEDLRVHDIAFHYFKSNAIYFCQNVDNTAVIDHCWFGNKAGTNAYGIRVTGCNNEAVWEYPPQFGGPNALFIEDCIFDGTYHPISQFTTAYVVARHNSFSSKTSAGLDGHGPGFDVGCGVSNPNIVTGMQKFEIYDNEWNGMAGYNIYQRGGHGIITDNKHYSPCKRAVQLEFDRASYDGRDNCNAASECPYATSGYETTEACYQSPKYIWIWNNYSECDYAVYANDKGTGCLRLEDEYYLRAPQADDPVESYTKYTYPHPLVSGNWANENIKPDPPINFRKHG